jgi:hypothetical protein
MDTGTYNGGTREINGSMKMPLINQSIKQFLFLLLIGVNVNSKNVILKISLIKKNTTNRNKWFSFYFYMF